MLLLKRITCPRRETVSHFHRETCALHHWPHALASNIILHYCCLNQTYIQTKKSIENEYNKKKKRRCCVLPAESKFVPQQWLCSRREQCSVWGPLSAIRGSETVCCLPVHLLYTRVLYLKSKRGLDEAAGNQLGCKRWLFNCSATCRRGGCHLLQTQH